ncbi:hypothetical protein KC344_g69 [Hortaea werneckii]|nr:hypothetical protein KC344_g69 [Hortaea werneckii]
MTVGLSDGVCVLGPTVPYFKPPMFVSREAIQATFGSITHFVIKLWYQRWCPTTAGQNGHGRVVPHLITGPNTNHSTLQSTDVVANRIESASLWSHDKLDAKLTGLM